MISHEEFGRLRLARFLPDTELADLVGWEFQDRMWIGEALRFSQWLRPVEEPERLRSLSLDFSTFPRNATAKVLDEVGLPLRTGMRLDELRRLFGEPAEVRRFVPDRVTYKFLTPGPEPYRISCTVRDDDGLSYLVVTAQHEE